jgi:hypothetical protein
MIETTLSVSTPISKPPRFDPKIQAKRDKPLVALHQHGLYLKWLTSHIIRINHFLPAAYEMYVGACPQKSVEVCLRNEVQMYARGEDGNVAIR